MNDIELWQGDCLELMKTIPNNSIDLIVTSPPYYNARDYSHWDSYKNYIAWLKSVFSEAYRICKDGRMCCVNISVIIEPREKRSTESKRIPLPFHFVNLMELIGFKFLEDIIWIKPDGAAKNRNGRFYQDRQPIQYKPNIVNEYIFVFQKPSKYLIDKILKEYSGEIKDKSLIKGYYERTNVWNINPETKSKHPAAFPIKIPQNLISYYSYKNDTVLDMFLGSGSTGVAAKNLHRRFIGIELDEKYFNIAKNRILETT